MSVYGMGWTYKDVCCFGKGGGMKVVFWHSAESAVGLYRQVTPAKYLAQAGAFEIHAVPLWQTLPRSLQMTVQDYNMKERMCWADCAVWGWFYDPIIANYMRASKADTGTRVFLDLDDEVFDVPAGHLAHDQFKFRTPEECYDYKEFPLEAFQILQRRGWEVQVQSALASPKLLARRRTAIAFRQEFEQILRDCDGLVVSTQYLEREYARYMSPNLLTAEAPNCYDPDTWGPLIVADEHPQPTIVWAGSLAHNGNVQVAFPALRKVVKAIPDVRLLVYGAELPAWKESKLPVEFVPWTSPEGYPQTLASLGGWVGIAPVTQEAFNLAKSHIRWMEYSLAGMATVGTSVPEMQRWAGEGMRFANSTEEWTEALIELLKDGTLRDALKQKAQERVVQCSAANPVNINAWAAAIQKLCKAERVTEDGVLGNKRGVCPEGVSVPAGA
jgi:glycosyltransferase involved in cell wall biosynthesis